MLISMFVILNVTCHQFSNLIAWIQYSLMGTKRSLLMDVIAVTRAKTDDIRISACVDRLTPGNLLGR